MTSRREFITLLGGAAAWPLAAHAQQPTMPVIGFMSARAPEDSVRLLAAFRRALSEGGFAEGQNIAIEFRWARGQYDQLPAMASDLVRRQVAVIVSTAGVQAALAAKAATVTIPIVFSTGGDPVQEGLVHSLRRPGGNLTGVTTSFADAAPKRLGLLREIVPKASAIGVLVNPSDPFPATRETDSIRTAARSVGQRFELLRAGTEREIDAAFATLIDMRLDALIVQPDAFFAVQVNQLIALAARHAVPAMYEWPEFVKAGGLISYSTVRAEYAFQAGLYAGRLLKGAKIADLPVVQSSKFELVINLKTAKALGLTVPNTLLVAADEVIE